MTNTLFALKRPRNHQVNKRGRGGGTRSVTDDRKTTNNGRNQVRFREELVPNFIQHVLKHIGNADTKEASADRTATTNVIMKRKRIPDHILRMYEGLRLSGMVKGYHAWLVAEGLV